MSDTVTEELRRSAKCVFLAMSEPVATVLFKQLHEAADIIERAHIREQVLLTALNFYMLICGNTCASVTRETAMEMYALAEKAIQPTNLEGME